MDTVYHRYCLDGAYSAYLLYLFSRMVLPSHLVKLMRYLDKQTTHDITDGGELLEDLSKREKVQITESWFHEKGEVCLQSFSQIAGEYQPFYPPINNKLVFIVDTHLANADNIVHLSKNYQKVVLIDHHTSFIKIKADLDKLQVKNLYYIFTEKYAASTLLIQFLDRYFNFSKALDKEYSQQLHTIIGYVQKNDLKRNEDKNSKSFVLGLYHFDIQVSDCNPNLFKRLGTFKLDYLLEKGASLLTQHLPAIQQEISRAEVVTFVGSARFKGIKFLSLRAMNLGIRSDVGMVMSYIGCKNSLANLALLYKNKRVSSRSSKHFKEPLALEIAQFYGGGGHKEASGFTLSTSQFSAEIKTTNEPKLNLKLNIGEIEAILFKKMGE